MVTVTVGVMTVVRLLLLGACVAAGWLALSLTVSTAPAASASTTTVGWAADADDRDHTGLPDLLNTVTGATEPLLEAATGLLQETTTNVDDVIDGTVQTVDTTFDSTLTTTRDIVDHVVTSVDAHVVDPVLDTIGDTVNDVVPPVAPGAIDETVSTGPEATPASTAGFFPVVGAGDSTSTVTEQVEASLWPLSGNAAPWSPRELILLSAGVLSASHTGSGSAGPGASDLPHVERWLGVDGGTVDAALNDRVPLSPSYDTDCTPD